MKSAPKIGTTEEHVFEVEAKHAIEFAGDAGMPAVLSTPSLIQFLERTARFALLPFQDENERSVGTEIELRHLAATPVGKKVTCLARIVHTEGRQISFHIEARDDHEILARGTHRRHIVRIASFARRVGGKS